MAQMDTNDARRIILAVGRNVGLHGDEMDLADLAGLRVHLDEAIGSAVVGMYARGLSWSNIGDALGVTKAAVYKRYAPLVAAAGNA